jgi:hypothetical protein
MDTTSYHARRNGKRGLDPDVNVIRCLLRDQRRDASRGPDCDTLREADKVKYGRTSLTLKYCKGALAHFPAILQPRRWVRLPFVSRPCPLGSDTL